MTTVNLNDEVLIAGAGLAGAASASLLARAGRPTLVIEKETSATHKVCGEFLSIEAQDYLARLGIDLDRLGASRIGSVRLIRGNRVVEAPLPFLARGLSRHRLDEALLRQAEADGARVLRGVTVRGIAVEANTINVQITELENLSAQTLFLATGKHDVRGVKREKAGTTHDLIGFKCHYRLTVEQQRAIAGCVEVALFTGGYAGLQMIEDGIANLCLVVTQERFRAVDRSWPGLLQVIGEEAPAVKDRLAGSIPLFERPLSISQVPYGFLHRAQHADPEGLFRIGDQAGVIPSYTGDGMAIALHSGCLAATTYIAHGRAGSAFHRQVQSDIQNQVRLASVLYSGIRRPIGQKLALSLCGMWPSVLRQIASATRLRDSALDRVLAVP